MITKIGQTFRGKPSLNSSREKLSGYQRIGKKETFLDWILSFHFSARLRASCTAPCWCGPSTGSGPASTRASRRPSQSSFLRSSLSTWGIIVHSLDTFADICLSRVREFLSYVVPSNTLSSEEFKARCIDVMTGSVRRTEEVSSFCQAPTQLPTRSPLQPNLISTSLQVNSTPPRVELELCPIFSLPAHHNHHLTTLLF